MSHCVKTSVFVGCIGVYGFHRFFLNGARRILTKLHRGLSGVSPGVTSVHFRALPFHGISRFSCRNVTSVVGTSGPSVV